MASDSADAGVEKVSPHSAELVEQVAAGDVIRIPKTLRLQALRMTADRNTAVVSTPESGYTDAF